MVRVQTSEDSKAVTVEGAECELMLFYCLWQSKLWPNWMSYSKLEDSNDAASRQHRTVINRIKEGQGLHLSYVGEQFESACNYAIERCLAMGLKVIVNEAAVV